MGSQIKYIQKYTNTRKQTPNIKMKNQQKKCLPISCECVCILYLNWKVNSSTSTYYVSSVSLFWLCLSTIGFIVRHGSVLVRFGSVREVYISIHALQHGCDSVFYYSSPKLAKAASYFFSFFSHLFICLSALFCDTEHTSVHIHTRSKKKSCAVAYNNQVSLDIYLFRFLRTVYNRFHFVHLSIPRIDAEPSPGLDRMPNRCMNIELTRQCTFCTE